MTGETDESPKGKPARDVTAGVLARLAVTILLVEAERAPGRLRLDRHRWSPAALRRRRRPRCDDDPVAVRVQDGGHPLTPRLIRRLLDDRHAGLA
jgi:hypothetical protein